LPPSSKFIPPSKSRPLSFSKTEPCFGRPGSPPPSLYSLSFPLATSSLLPANVSPLDFQPISFSPTPPPPLGCFSHRGLPFVSSTSPPRKGPKGRVALSLRLRSFMSSRGGILTSSVPALSSTFPISLFVFFFSLLESERILRSYFVEQTRPSSGSAGADRPRQSPLLCGFKATPFPVSPCLEFSFRFFGPRSLSTSAALPPYCPPT